MSQGTSRVYELLIKATPERVWQALTDGELTKDYYYGGRIESSWQKGAGYQFREPDGQPGSVFGEIVEVNAPHKLVTTFQTAWDPEGTPASTLIWEIESAQPLTKLTFTHQDFIPEADVNSGWVLILSGLKTLLETGQPMGMPEPTEAEASAVS